ncbi:hypothetical protein [Streptomyces sp. TRM68416]|uniref:hypothetical protein n=1 Tax=Streptomyces sp. TRM68416 TaxID=2758412 RepID=UPI001661F0F3|nr:hypothetical protein [Streptomyces sp. TRM68416]MBD0844772.1 hypothetical protein [Streptomyces sp. TRM68416]
MSPLSSRQHRAVRLALFILLAVAFVVFVIWMSLGDLEANSAWAGVLGLFLAMAGLMLPLADGLRTDRTTLLDMAQHADDLAATVRDDWQKEAVARGLSRAGVLPLAWAGTRRPVGDAPQHVLGQSAGPTRVLRLRLAGRLNGNLDDSARTLAEAYGQVPSGRLVILGEPGAGKTVLAMLLTLGLLGGRGAGERVPVLLAPADWDPVREPLDDWIVRTVAATYYGGQREVPRLLLAYGLLLPIIDGLDEIAEAARRSAVKAIGYAVGQDRPVVVTCRSVEYEDVITAGSPTPTAESHTLRRAPVVEVEPVPAEAAIAYLSHVHWPDGVDWSRVYAELRSPSDGPVTIALTTPLMVSLARVVYERLGGDPGEKLDPHTFRSRHAVEDHLLNQLVQAAYAPDRLPSGQPITPDRRTPDTADALRWLTFLARYLHRWRERDFAWWLLPGRVFSTWAAPAIGLAVAVPVMTVVAAWLLWTDLPDTTNLPGAPGPVASGVFVGAGSGVVVTITWYAGAARRPARLSFALRGSLSRLRRGMRYGLLMTGVPGATAMVAAAVALSAGKSWSYSSTRTYCMIVAVGAALFLVLSLGLAAQNWLDAAPVRAAQADPVELLRADRRSALLGATVAGVVAALGAFPAVVAGLVAGYLMNAILTGWSGEPNLTELVPYAFDVIPGSRPVWPTVATISGVVGVTIALLTCLTRAWPRFAVATLILAIGGQLPWRPMRFLADARARELLRQSGGTFQFRHARLQERLVEQPYAHGPLIRARKVKIAIAMALAIALVGGFLVHSTPKDSSRATLLIRHPGMTDISGDGSLLVGTHGSTGKTRLWNLRERELLKTLRTGWVDNVSLSADGKILATAESGTGAYVIAKIWNTVSGRVEHFFRIKYPQFTGFEVFELSPDGHTLAVNLGDPCEVQLWNTGTGEKETALPVRCTLQSATFDEKGEAIVTVIDVGTDAVRTVWEVWDIETGKREKEAILGEDAYQTMVNESGRAIVVGSGDGTYGVWGVLSGAKLDSGGSGGNLLAFSRDGRMIAFTDSGDPSVVLCVDALTGAPIGKPKRGHRGEVGAGLFSADGRTLITVSTVDGTVKFWPVDSS